MQVSISNTNGIGRQMSVTLPAQQVEQEVTKRLSHLRKTAKLPGFRPGKIPASVIEKKFGVDVLNEIAGEMINRSCFEALDEQKIEPATRPVIEPKDITRGQDIEFTATFDVFPDITRTDLAGISIEKQFCEINDEDIDNTIMTIRKQRAIWNPTHSPAQQDNRVTIDFKGTVDGQAFDGGDAKDYRVVIGQGALLKDFESGIIGMKTGDIKTIDVAFPQDYPAKNLTGKIAQFEITVGEVAQPELPNVDESFIKSLGIDEGSEQKFRNQIKENMERELKNRIQAVTREKVFTELLDQNDIQLPKQLVDNETEHILEANRQQIKKQVLSDSKTNLDKDKIREQAARRVKLGVITRQVISSHNLKLDRTIIDQHINEMASTYEDKDTFVKWYSQDRHRMAQLESAALEQLVVDKLLETADVVEKIIPFKELMNLK